jgi:hypothetical protein
MIAGAISSDFAAITSNLAVNHESQPHFVEITPAFA